jgi:hypothetical protein
MQELEEAFELALVAPPAPPPPPAPLAPLAPPAPALAVPSTDTLPEQPAAAAVATKRPSRMAPAVRGTLPSSFRSVTPQCGHETSAGRAWQLHAGQAISVSPKYMLAIGTPSGAPVKRIARRLRSIGLRRLHRRG